ncbi:MAG: hypothetical protein ACOC33_01930 [bacterium]
MKKITLGINDPYYNLIAISFYLLKDNYLPTHILPTDSYDNTRTICFKKASDNSFRQRKIEIESINNTSFSLRIEPKTIWVNYTTRKENTKIECDSRIGIKPEENQIDIVSESSYKNLDSAFIKFKFFENNYEQVSKYLEKIVRLTTDAENIKLAYSTNTFYKLKKMINILDHDFSKLKNQPREEYINFIDFLIDFEKDRCSIDKIQIKNITITKYSTSTINISIGSQTIFHEHELGRFKFIDHPGLYLSLYFIENVNNIKNKFFKEKLELI